MECHMNLRYDHPRSNRYREYPQRLRPSLIVVLPVQVKEVQELEYPMSQEFAHPFCYCTHVTIIRWVAGESGCGALDGSLFIRYLKERIVKAFLSNRGETLSARRGVAKRSGPVRGVNHNIIGQECQFFMDGVVQIVCQ